jgi:hypothetical protein
VANGEPLAGRDSPGIFIMRGCGLHWVLSFDNAWVSGGEGERESEVGRNKIKKTKSFSSPVAHSGEEEEEEECCLKRYCFVFLSFFCVGIQK